VRTASHAANGFTVPPRTTAVFVRAGQTSCAPYPRDLFVRGSFNDWGNPTPTEQYKLQFLGGTDYSVGAPVTGGAQQFKIADAAWTADTNCGAGAAGGNVRLGIPITLACNSSSGNLALEFPASADYTFGLSAVDVASPALTVTKTPPTTRTLYVRGGFTDWGTTAPLTYDGLGTYRAVIGGLAAQSYEFKIADADWTAETNCGAATGGTSVTLGQPYTLTCNSSTQNIGVTFPAAGSYLFAVDTANPAALRLMVEHVPVDAALFLRGIGGDWSDGAQNQMSYLGSGVYGINKQVAPVAQEFKIATSDWATVDCGGGADGVDVTIGTPLALSCNSGPPNLKIAPATSGIYTFKYTRESTTAGELTVTGP
jgi:pullulanase